MATKANTSSVDTKKGDRLASIGTQKIANMKAGYKPEEKKVDGQVINANKVANLSLAKAKAKRKAKLAKKSRKKNKK